VPVSVPVPVPVSASVSMLVSVSVSMCVRVYMCLYVSDSEHNDVPLKQVHTHQGVLQKKAGKQSQREADALTPAASDAAAADAAATVKILESRLGTKFAMQNDCRSDF